MYALGKMGRDIPPRESLYRFIGPPLHPSFMDFLGMTDDEAIEAVRLYRVYFSEGGLFENEIYKGIPEELEKLTDYGATLVLATSKPEEFAKKILEHFALDKYFTIVCGASMDSVRSAKTDVIKYALEKIKEYDSGFSSSDAVMVGDRHHDINGAHGFSIPAIGVLWGFGSREEFAECKADYIAEDVGSLSVLIKKL